VGHLLPAKIGGLAELEALRALLPLVPANGVLHCDKG